MSKKAKLWSRVLAVVVIVLAMGAGCTFVGLNFFDVDLYSQRIICLVGIWAAVTVMICNGSKYTSRGGDPLKICCNR